MDENFPAGWYFSAAANLNDWCGRAGEVPGGHKTPTGIAPVSVKTNLYTPMGGPRFFSKRGRTVLLAESLSVRAMPPYGSGARWLR